MATMNTAKHLHQATRWNQSGQTILLMVLLLVLGGTAAFFGLASPDTLDAQSIRRTESALALAKDALIGRAVSDDNRPGSLPCPDTDNDGSAELLAGNQCPRYLGRLPWRTLGLPDLRDANGERFWYALDANFRDDTSAQPINTDTRGSRIVYSGNNSTQLTNLGAAILFAPGPPIGNQSRSDTQSSVCPTTGTTILEIYCAANYLESASGVNNASQTGPYINAGKTATFNDQIAILDSIELMMPVEARAAREILALLAAYKTNSLCDISGDRCYPFADSNFTGNAVWNANEGTVPLDDADSTEPFGEDMRDWGQNGIPVPAAWLTANDWNRVFLYTVADSQDYFTTSSSQTLEVDGVNAYHVVLVATGAASAARTSFPTGYIEDSNNSDLGRVFITPSSTARNRDRLYVIP